MSADAATSVPTKRGRKAWLIALAVVVAVVTIALLANAPKSEPVKVWFVRTTNEAGVEKLVFEGTNGTTRAIEVYAFALPGAVVGRKGVDRWSEMLGYTNTVALGGKSFDFTLEEVPKDLPYCVKWAFYEVGRPPTRWERLRARYHDFFFAHGMYRLANLLYLESNVHIILSTEIKE